MPLSPTYTLFRAFKRLSRGREISRYLASAGPHCLHIGCGSNILPGWLNTDIHPSRKTTSLDATDMGTIVSGSFDAAFCEHMIEHVPLSVARCIFREIHRILKPSGVFRVVTPSLTAFCRLAVDNSYGQDYMDWYRKFSERPLSDPADAINDIFYGHGHRFIWSSERLARELSAAGFSDIQPYRAECYGSRIFDGVDHHGHVIGRDANLFESIAIEARKSSAGDRDAVR